MAFSDVNPHEEAEGQWLLRTAFETAPVADGLAGRAAIGGDLPRSVRQRLRRVRRTRVLVPAGALLAAGAGALAVTMTASVTAGPAPTRPAGVAAASARPPAPSALAVLTAAVTKTSAQSFAFTTLTTTKQSASLGPSMPSVKITGSFDPTSKTGEESMSLFGPGVYGDTASPFDMASQGVGEGPITGSEVAIPEALTPGSHAEVIFDGSHMYAQAGPQTGDTNGKPWLESALPSLPPASKPSSGAASGYIGDEPIGPSDLLGLIKSDVSLENGGAVSGPGWTGTKYEFTVHDKNTSATGHITSTVTYTIEVDSQGLVRDVRSTTTDVAKSTSAPKQVPNSVAQQDPTPNGTDVVTEETTYSGFGTRVSAPQPPPASEVYNCGNQFTIIAVY